MNNEEALPVRRMILTWVALMMLLGLNMGSAFLPLGNWNLVLNLAFAAAKALLIMAVFMQLARRSGLMRIVAATGFLWLAFLFTLSLADYLTRASVPGWMPTN
jgi:cytochrome c oxidase subunit 4